MSEIINRPSDNVEVLQKAAFGSTTTQIGVQYNGLSVNDAMQMAFSMFHKYYPQLQQEALDMVRNMVNEELSKHEKEHIIAPKAKTVIPVLQNASITEETNLRAMYAKLLARSMVSPLQNKSHPSFVEMINQMSSFDALVFKTIMQINNSIPLASVTFTFDTSYLTSILPHFYSIALADLGDPFDISMSLENLDRLKLINLFEGSVNSFNYENFKINPYIIDRFEYAKKMNSSRELQIHVSAYVVQPNDFGRLFAKMCM